MDKKYEICRAIESIKDGTYGDEKKALLNEILKQRFILKLQDNNTTNEIKDLESKIENRIEILRSKLNQGEWNEVYSLFSECETMFSLLQELWFAIGVKIGVKEFTWLENYFEL